jgi:hypothetical protein
MTIVPAASLIPEQPATPSEIPGLPKSGESLHKLAASWLAVEDEYFPFDADSFEVR